MILTTTPPKWPSKQPSLPGSGIGDSRNYWCGFWLQGPTPSASVDFCKWLFHPGSQHPWNYEIALFLCMYENSATSGTKKRTKFKNPSVLMVEWPKQYLCIISGFQGPLVHLLGEHFQSHQVYCKEVEMDSSNQNYGLQHSMIINLALFFLRCNSHAIKFTIFECTIQQHFVMHKVVQPSSLCNSKTFYHPKKPVPIISHSPFPLSSSPC